MVLGFPEGEPRVFVGAIMPLRSLASGGSYPDSAACPTLCLPHGAVLPPPTSTPTSIGKRFYRSRSSPQLHGPIVPAPILRENPLHSHQSPPAATHSARRSPSSASATDSVSHPILRRFDVADVILKVASCKRVPKFVKEEIRRVWAFRALVPVL